MPGIMDQKDSYVRDEGETEEAEVFYVDRRIYPVFLLSTFEQMWIWKGECDESLRGDFPKSLKFTGSDVATFFDSGFAHPEHDSENNVISHSSLTVPSSQRPRMSLAHCSFDLPGFVDLTTLSCSTHPETHTKETHMCARFSGISSRV